MLHYFVFKGSDYYPRGGMEDFYKAFINQDDAIRCALALTAWETDWSHVYDSITHEIIAKFECVGPDGTPTPVSTRDYSHRPWEDHT
jgi:hypothetical protein